MAQDNTPAIVMYKGPQEDGYSIPFDKGFYGEVKVAFVRRGLTDYEYEPTTYTVDGALYAWEISTGVYYYTKSASPAVGATVYDSGNQEISGVKVVSTQNASASFSDGNTGIRSNKKDIHSHALLFWTGESLGDDDWICIVRDTVKKQPYSYPNNQKHIEGALDNLSRQIQELKAQSDVSLKVDPTFVQDPAKMNPIDWLNTIVRSTDTTARGLRYRNFWLEYSTDDPNKAESDKSWTKLLNTTNITSVREWYDEDNNMYIPQYSMDGGLTWKALGAVHLIEDVQEQIDELKENVYTKTQVDDKVTVINTAIDANADAIQKTREDYIQADSEIHQILNAHASELTTQRNDIDGLGDQVSAIEEKIPETASAENPLVTRSEISSVYKFKGSVATYNDLPTGATVGDVYNVTDTGANYAWDGSAWDKLSETVDLSSYATTAYVDAREQDIRDDYMADDAALQTQINGQATAITNLEDGVDSINGKIPTSASTTNLLATIADLDATEQDIRSDYMQADSDLQTQINAHATAITGNTDGITAINAKIPATTSADNMLVNNQQMSDMEMNLREDIDTVDGELQTQINAQATTIAGKQDKLIAGDNIIISGNVISATGAGGGVGFDVIVVQELPESGEKGIIYLVPKDSAAPDIYDEYVWVTTTSTFELIGTTQVDLTDYVKNTDYATGQRGGVFKTTDSYAAAVDGSGYLRSVTKNLSAYNSGTANMFVCKGTLENIKEDLVARAIANAVNTENLTVGTDEGTLNIGITAGVATIATNNGLDIAAQTKFDTAPTTDDSTTYANALDTSLVRKAQVATAIADAVNNIDALPDQTGNAGKVLTTDGSSASWTEMSGLIIRRL